MAIQLSGVWLTMQRVDAYTPPTWPDPTVPQQSHLDFAVDDLESAEQVALQAGAELAGEQPSPDRWRVLVDPAGHTFCLSTLIPE
jgi:predicted enzyme related to lactoylglutathione lyase